MMAREGIVGIHHVNFSVENLDRTVDFYTKLLGFELRSRAAYHGDVAVAVDLLGDLHAEETKEGVTAEIAVLELTGTRVEFMQWLTPKTAPYHHDISVAGAAHLGVRVKNVSEVRKRLQEAGVVFRSPVDHLHEEVGHRPWQWCSCLDPDGMIVELIQEQPITDLVGILGSRIREARLARGLTLKQAATMSEISTAHLSQVERGDAIPSLSALVGISATLGVAPEYFLRVDIVDWQLGATGSRPTTGWQEPALTGKGVRVVKADDLQGVTVTGGVEWHWLTDESTPTRIIRIRFQPGAASEDRGGFGQLGREITVVLEGTIQIELESQSQVLDAGSTIAYERSSRRRFTNVGTVPAVALWVVSENGAPSR